MPTINYHEPEGERQSPEEKTFQLSEPLSFRNIDGNEEEYLEEVTFALEPSSLLNLLGQLFDSENQAALEEKIYNMLVSGEGGPTLVIVNPDYLAIADNTGTGGDSFLTEGRRYTQPAIKSGLNIQLDRGLCNKTYRYDPINEFPYSTSNPSLSEYDERFLRLSYRAIMKDIFSSTSSVFYPSESGVEHKYVFDNPLTEDIKGYISSVIVFQDRQLQHAFEILKDLNPDKITHPNLKALIAELVGNTSVELATSIESAIVSESTEVRYNLNDAELKNKFETHILIIDSTTKTTGRRVFDWLIEVLKDEMDPDEWTDDWVNSYLESNLDRDSGIWLHIRQLLWYFNVINKPTAGKITIDNLIKNHKQLLSVESGFSYRDFVYSLLNSGESDADNELTDERISYVTNILGDNIYEVTQAESTSYYPLSPEWLAIILPEFSRPTQNLFVLNGVHRIPIHRFYPINPYEPFGDVDYEGYFPVFMSGGTVFFGIKNSLHSQAQAAVNVSYYLMANQSDYPAN